MKRKEKIHKVTKLLVKKKNNILQTPLKCFDLNKLAFQLAKLADQLVYIYILFSFLPTTLARLVGSFSCDRLGKSFESLLCNYITLLGLCFAIGISISIHSYQTLCFLESFRPARRPLGRNKSILKCGSNDRSFSLFFSV